MPAATTSSDRAEREALIRAALARYERPLVAYARRIVGDLERARDVVQETFLRLWQAPEDLDGRLAAWLFTVCRNRALDVARKESRMHLVPDAASASTTPAREAPDVAAERRERVGTVLDALETLPERQRELVRLRFQAGMSYRDIAEATGLSVSYVGYLLHMAVKGIRTELGRTQR